VYRQASAHVRVSIAAENPVVLAGLRRVAAVNGVHETMVVGDEDFTLRSANARDAVGALDVNCSDDAVVVTVHCRPSLEIWTLILDIVEQVLPTWPASADRRA
jgi:hypothetical protein